jgi:hypothetical protein
MDFMAFREKIIAMDNVGRTYLYEDPSLSWIPTMPQRILKPITVAVGDNSLFVMSRCDPQFVALMHDSSSTDLSKSCWYWQNLQPPPFLSRTYGDGYSDRNRDMNGDSDGEGGQDEEEDEDEYEDTQHSIEIGAYTVVGNSQLLVSAAGAGTFSFDTESCTWSKAGEWLLPFRGGAEYLPEHNLWFGFSNKNELLCIADLSAVSAASMPPVVLQNLSQDLVWPENWTLLSTELLPLGSGKLCIARLFLASDEDKWGFPIIGTENTFVVLVGVQVVAHEGGLRMIRHKSERYNFGLDFPDLL